VPQESIPEPTPPFRERHATAIGESRDVPLPDGSHLRLDTDSRVLVVVDDRSRTVHLESGQVFSEVARDPQRPFVVEAGRLTLTAVGTAFSVRRVGADIRVVVAEGTVRLGREGARDDLLAAGAIARVEGEIVQLLQGRPAEVERNLSWLSGLLTFRHTPLSDAAAEFNRYGTRRIVIRDPEIATLELGGVFQSDDVESFARGLERTFAIDADFHPDRIELSARRSP
jgi:transmembrane sensor